MQQLFRMRDADGNDYDVPNSDMAEFSGAVPNAANVTRYRDADGNDYDVPDADKAEFSAAVPNAQPLRRVQMDDGKSIYIADDAMRGLIQLRSAGNSISRRQLQSAGIPDFYGKGVIDRAKLVDNLAAIFPAEQQNLGVMGTLKAQKEAELGREMTYGETIAHQIPFLGSILDASEKGKESNERRLYNGDFRDTLEATRLARVVGIPADKIDEINEEVNKTAKGRTVFGAPINPDVNVARQRYHEILRDALIARIQTRAKAGEQLSNSELGFLQKVGVGAIGAGRTIAEMANAPIAAATLGISATNRAGDLANGPMVVDAQGNIQTFGDTGDAAMLKGFTGATGERLVWMGLGKAASALPGGKAVADLFSRNAVTKNIGEIGGMVVKQRLTNLVDDVIGLNVREGEERKEFSEWAKDFVSVSSNAEMLLEMLPIHFAMKGIHRITPSGRRATKDRKAMVGELSKYVGADRIKDLSDTDIANLYRYITSPHLTKERVENFMKGVESEVLKRGEAERAIDKDWEENAEFTKRAADNRARIRRTPDAVQTAALDEAINGVVGGEENAKAIRDKVLSGIDDARVLDDPQARERLVEEAANSLFGEAKDGVARTEVGGRAEENAAAKERFDANRAKAEKEAAEKAAAEHRAKSMAGMEERARRKADMAEYERQEAERRAREEAEQNAPEPVAEKPSAPESPLPDVSGREQWPEYYDWLKRHGRNDTDKKWRKFVAENDLDPALADRKPTPTAGKPAVRPDGKGGMVPVEEPEDRPRIQKPRPNFRHPTENHAEPPQESVETRPVAETGKETPEPAKPVEAPSRASDAKPVPDGKGKMAKPKAESTTKTRSLEDIMADIDRANEAFEKAGRENDPSFEQKKEALAKLHSEYDKALAEKNKARQGFIDAIERQADKNVESNSKAGELGADGKPKPIDEATKSDLKTHYVFQAFEEGISDSGKLSSKEGVGEVFDMFKKLVEKYNPARDENGTISMQSVRRAAWMIESSDFATKEQKAFAHKYGEKFRTSTDKPVPDGKGKMVKPKAENPTPPAEPLKPDGKGKMVKPAKDVSGSFQEKFSTIVGQLSESQKKTVANWLKGSGATRENIVNSDDIFIDKDGSVWFLRNEDGGISAVQLEKTKKSRGGNIHIRRFDTEGRESHGGAVNKSDVPTLDAESVKRLAAARNKTSASVPDGKGKMVKPNAPAPVDTTPLSDAIAEAKALAGKKKSKAFEVKVGTTTVKFTSGKPESIAQAEKLLEVIKHPTDASKKPSEVKSVPKPPNLTVATGKKIKGFSDVSKDFVSKDDTRKALKTPIVQGGSIYATDGHAVIRMSAPKGAADTAGAPDCASLFRHAEGEKAKAAFVMDVKKAHAGLEQVKAIPQENGAVVEMWLSPSGEVMFRARSDSGTSPAAPSEHVAFSGTSLRGAQFIGTYEPSYLSKIVKSFAKLGDGKVDVEQRGNMLWLKGKNADVLLMPKRTNGAFGGDELSILMGGKTDLTAQQRDALVEGNPKLKKALKRNPSQDPLFSVNPDADMPTAEPKNEKAKLQRIEPIASEPPKSPEQEIAERLDLKRLDPKRRSDPKVLAWAKKNGRNVTNGTVTPDAVRTYDETMTENTARLAKRWFPDTKIVAHKFGETIKRGQHVIDLRDTSGGVLGWFDPRSKEIHLLPGADPKTVAHEIMWHGTRDYITQLAGKGDAKAQKFLDMMHDVEKNAPQQVKDVVNRLYARGGKPVSRDTLLNEYGAWATMGKGGEALEKALQKAENRNWFAKAVYTVKEMVKDFLTAHGRNRVDLSAIDGMTRDEFVDFLAKEFSSGRTLGKIKGDQPPTLSTKETRLGKYKRRVYDQNAAVRDLERDIEKKTGRKISVDDSVEAANALKYGLKEAANIETQGEMREFRKVLSETGIHYEDLEYYAALKAAAGRDAKIDARNIAKLTADLRAQGASASDIATAVANYKSSNGSHIDPREARMMLNEIENGPDAANFKKAYDAIRPIIDATLDTQVKAGLVGAAEAAQWRAEEPNYIPFKNEYDAETGEWAGRGMSRNYAKPEHYTAKGRQSAAGDILAHIFMDHQAAKLRAIENGVRQKLANLVRANPELGKVEALGKNETGIEASSPNVVVFKDGGQAYKITLEGTRGEAIANAFTQRNQLKMGWADKKFMGVSARSFAHWSAGMATRYSLTFSVRNTTKDNIELANIVYSERGPVEGTKWMMQYAKTRAETLKNVANVLTGHKLGIDGDTVGAALGKYITTGKIDASSEGGKILDRYIKAGGLIAGGTRAEAFDSIKKSLTPEAIAKEMRRGNSKMRAVAKHTLNSIGYLNEYAEMATRVGIFATEVRAGKSDAEAALFSRRATVDFNRHGDWTPGFNLFRLFSNSNLGASARAVAALTKNKYGAAVVGALFVNGVARTLVDHFVNAEEDERRRKTGEATGKDISEYERRTSLFYFRSGDKLYKVAEHESPFSLISYAGDCVGRWICGDLDGKQVAKNLGVTTAEVAYNFLPMGSINLTAQNGGFADDAKAAFISGVLPTALQPAAEVIGNLDYAGRSIFNQPVPGDRTPRSEQGRDSTPDWAKEAAVKLNESTRSEGSRKGYVDIPPEAIQKLVEGYGKNALRDVSMAVSVGEAIIKGDFSRLDPRNKPVKRDFVRPLDGNDKRFGAAMKKFEANLDYFKKTEMTEDERIDYLAKFPHIRGKRGSDLLAAIKKFRKMERGFAYKNGKAIPHEWPQEKLDEFKAKRRALQAQFLELMGD